MGHVNFESLNCEVTGNKILNQSVINIHPNKQSDCIKSTDLVLPESDGRNQWLYFDRIFTLDFSVFKFN